MSEDLLSALDDYRDHTTSPFLEEVFARAYAEIVRLQKCIDERDKSIIERNKELQIMSEREHILRERIEELERYKEGVQTCPICHGDGGDEVMTCPMCGGE